MSTLLNDVVVIIDVVLDDDVVIGNGGAGAARVTASGAVDSRNSRSSAVDVDVNVVVDDVDEFALRTSRPAAASMSKSTMLAVAATAFDCLVADVAPRRDVVERA